MRFENPDALKKWLISCLGDLCSSKLNRADLAKYILTLVKNDKPEEELKKFCVEQLDIFLREAQSFVDTLFKVIKDKSYVGTDYTPFGEASKSLEKVERRKITQANKEFKDQSPRGSLKSVIGSSSGLVSKSKNGSSETVVRVKSEDGTDDRFSDEKSSRQEKHSAEDDDATKSKKLRSDSRMNNGVESRSTQKRNIDDRSNSRQHSNSSYSVKRSRNALKGQYLTSVSSYDDANAPQYTYEPVDSNARNNDASCQRDGRKNEVRKQGRCEDYNERGFCVRGENCQYDHGTDPLVVEGAPLLNFDASVLQAAPPFNYGGTAPPHVLPQPPPPGVLPPIPPLPPAPGLLPYTPTMFPPGLPTYNPKAPAMFREKTAYNGQNVRPYWPQNLPYLSEQNLQSMMHSLPPEIPQYDPTRPPPPFHPHPKVQRPRELINVPTTGPVDSTSQEEVVSSSSPQAESPKQSRNQSAQAKKLMAYCEPAPGCVLKVTNVPKNLNTVQHLSSHFHKFGHVRSILTNVDDDAGAALICYSKVAEAQAAFRFKGVVLANPAIKIALYDTRPEKPTSSENAASSTSNVENLSQSATKVEVQSTKIEHASPPKVIPPKKFDLRTVINSRKTRNTYSLVASANKQPKAQQLEMMKRKLDLQKKKQEMVQSYLENQKVLLKKLATSKSQAQRDAIKQLIETLTTKIQNLVADMKNEKIVTKKSNTTDSTENEAEVEKHDNDVNIKDRDNEEDISDELVEEMKLNQIMFEDEDDEESDDEDRSWRR